MKLSEQELVNIVKRGIMESLEQDIVNRETNRHYFDFSEASKKLDRIEKATGWKRALYRDTGESYEFYLCPNGGAQLPAEEVQAGVQRMFKNDLEDIKMIGRETMVVKLKKAWNRDFSRSQEFGKSKWESPNPNGLNPAGVPDAK